MIIAVEERFAKAAQRFLSVLKTIDEAAGRDAPVHEMFTRPAKPNAKR